MKSESLTVSPTDALAAEQHYSWLVRGFRHLLARSLENLQEGQLIVNDALGEQRFGQAVGRTPSKSPPHTRGRLATPSPSYEGEGWGGGVHGRDDAQGYQAEVHRRTLSVRIEINDPEFYRLAVTRGHMGVAEAYMAGYWRCDHLTDLVRLFVRNRDAMAAMEGGFAWLAQPLFRLYHWSRRNTRSQSRANIAAHYDLGNEFYRLFLDETMMYSCAVYPKAQSNLSDASRHKLERICQKLDLKPEDHLLEIGTGWGEMAIHAASQYGCRVTTTTISQEQYKLALARVVDAGLEDRITVLCEDYRDLRGQFDKLVSVEMIEAVGHQFLDNYVQTCSRLLKPEGMMMLQSITIADQHYEAAKRYGDFIQRYIFPGGFLPSVAALSDAVSRVSDMRLFHLEDIGPHYARTLRDWRERFFASLEQVRELGFSDTFVRMWEFYLCYCEGGFLERHIGTVQVLLVKPRNRRESLIPSLEGV